MLKSPAMAEALKPLRRLERAAREAQAVAEAAYARDADLYSLKKPAARDAARKALLPLADDKGFEVELQNGVLDLVFEEPSPAKFVVSPNAPVRQIWVSAMAKSYKLAWDEALGAFAINGEPLPALLDRLARAFLQQ